MLVQSCGAIAVEMVKSKIQWLSTREQGRNALPDCNLVRSVSLKEFQTSSPHVNNEVKESGGSYYAWIVPTVFTPMPLINDPQYLGGNRTLQIVQDSNWERDNVKFVQKPFPKSSSGLK